MGLVARHLEANGIPTVTIATARDITASTFPPRAVFVNYPLGNPCGRPGDPDNQREIVGAALAVLESAQRPGEIVDLPHRWREEDTAADEWMDHVYIGEHIPSE